jgi:signal transduction histidine kinase
LRHVSRAEEIVTTNNEIKNWLKELTIANKEIAFQNEEKAHRAEELIIANIELAFQNQEKSKRAEELKIANKELIIANEELINADKAQGEFLVNITHELKTPLNVIFSAIQLFQMYCNNNSLDERREIITKYLDSMKMNSYRLSKLINNIVDSSKIQAGFFKLNLSNNNIVQVVEEIVLSVTNFTENKGLNIIFDTNIEEKIIACDPEKIERIVLNLISNAIKFSDKGGEIFIDVNDKNEFVEISVKDDGIGIDDNYLGMIFDKFKQVDKSLSRNAEGTGIGLSLVKSIVELHDGSIYVESELGKGSKFTVCLPSKKVVHENMLYNNEVKSNNENIRVEFSDIYS